MTSDDILALAIEVLTAATAVTASWATSRGTIRATHIATSAEAQKARHDRVENARRTSYTALLTCVTATRWQLIAAMNHAANGDATATSAILNTRNELVASLGRDPNAFLLDGL